MKKLTILLFSILISFNSYGEWMELVEDSDGNTFYIDTDTIKEHKGYVYWWYMIDFIKPFEDGDMSGKSYHQGDCGMNRYKNLLLIMYNQPMGEGTGEIYSHPNPEWEYPSPYSRSEMLLRHACKYTGN